MRPGNYIVTPMSQKKKKQEIPTSPTAGPPSAPAQEKFNPLGIALITALSLFVTLGAAEIWCRFAFRKNIQELKFSASDLYYYYDRQGYRHHIPKRVGYERSWNDQGKVEIRIDSLGFRGAEVALPKPTGTYRILFLGNSITLGGRLPEDATFVSRIRQALAKRGSKYEVVNAGVGDVGLFEEERTLKSTVLEAKPDLVVLCWYLNDARPPIGFPEEVVYDNPAISWFHAHPILFKSYLTGFLYDTLRRSIVERHASKEHRFDWVPAYVKHETWDHDPAGFAALVNLARVEWGDGWNDSSLNWMAQKIVSLRDFAEQHEMRFVVVAFPAQAQAVARFDAPIRDKPQRVMATALSKSGVPFFDLLPGMQARVFKAPALVWYDQCHFTPYGNQLVADATLEFLQKTKLLSK